MSRISRRIAMIAAATAVALAACEILARIAFPAPPDPTREPQIVYQVDPEIRYVLASNQRGWVDDGFVTTNGLGFRGGDVAAPKPSGRYRIVVLGDSVAFGWGVNDGETFSAQTERLLKQADVRDVEVVNLAVPGYATRQEVSLLRRHVAALEPDLVLVGFYTNDLPDTFEDKTQGAASGTTIAAANAGKGQILRMNPAPASWYERLARKSRAVYTGGHALKQLVRRGEGKPGSSMELDLLENRDTTQLASAWSRIEGEMARLHDAAAESHFSVGIVVLPPREQVLGLFSASQYQTRVRALAERFGFFVVDPLPALIASSRPKQSLFIPYDRNHPSATGHQVIAESIVDYVKRHEGAAGLSAKMARKGS